MTVPAPQQEILLGTLAEQAEAQNGSDTNDDNHVTVNTGPGTDDSTVTTLTRRPSSTVTSDSTNNHEAPRPMIS